MKLTKDQIQELYKFAHAHFVEHYDLQTELVDYLAKGIEAQWEETPKVPFNASLNKEFKKFGVFGFQNVISDKTRLMEKRYWKILLGFYKNYFKLPKVLFLIGGSVLLFLVLQNIPVEIAQYIPAGLLFLVLGVLLTYNFANKKKQKKKAQRWMLEDIMQTHGNSFAFLNLFLQIAIYPGWIEGPPSKYYRNPFDILNSYAIPYLNTGYCECHPQKCRRTPCRNLPRV